MTSFFKKYQNVISAYLKFIIVFCLVLAIGELFTEPSKNLYVSLSRAILLSSGFTFIIWRSLKGYPEWKNVMGISYWNKNVRYFLLGAGILLLPLTVTLALSVVFGWASYTINPNVLVIKQQLLALVVVFFFEAFPEEIGFRGYIFGSLRKTNGAWRSAIITIVLFFVFPLVVVPIQKYLLGIEGSWGRNTELTMGYLTYMFIFGGLTVFLRHLTQNIFTSMGFHLIFVSMNNLIGITGGSLIVITGYTTELPIQITLLCCILITIAFISIYARRRFSSQNKVALSNQ